MAGEPAVIELANGIGKISLGEEARLLEERVETSSALLDEEEGPPVLLEGASRLRRLLMGIGAIAALVVPMAILLILITLGWFEPEPAARFFVIGDWGRDGLQNQSLVAQAMADKAAKFKPDFVVSVGDNMYENGVHLPHIITAGTQTIMCSYRQLDWRPKRLTKQETGMLDAAVITTVCAGGLISVEDEQFTTSFSAVYNHSALQVPWHVILGNHDYGEYWNETRDLKQCPEGSEDCYLSPLHQLNRKLRERDWRWHCERSFQVQVMGDRAELFFIDTNPFILEYHSQPWAANRGGILEQSWEAQLLELDARLAASSASWKLVFGHHPVRNNHMPWNTPELIEHLEPILEKWGVQAYFSGHEHNLQYLHLDASQLHYIVSGGGSKTDYFPETYWDNGGSLFQHQGSGFVSCKLTHQSLECDFWGIATSEPLLSISIFRPAGS